jgi:Plasmid pRiA4b ORF-3-like protein.
MSDDTLDTSHTVNIGNPITRNRQKAAQTKTRATASHAATIHQFRITLDGIKPPIWRRIQLPSDANFWDLHCAINDAMGWEDMHLHAFQVGDKRNGIDIGIPMASMRPRHLPSEPTNPCTGCRASNTELLRRLVLGTTPPRQCRHENQSQ